MVTLLKQDAVPYGWKTNVVTSDGDIGRLASKMEDVITSKVSTVVVVSTNLQLLKKQIADAGKAHIPVFGLDAAAIPGVAAAVSSSSDQMSGLVTRYLFKQMGYKGNVVVLTYTPQPEVNERTMEFYRLVKQYPGIHVVIQKQIDVSSMAASGAKIAANLLSAYPQLGAITAFWCGWDQPAVGATLAIQATHRKGVLVTGIDGSDQAISLITKGSPLIATVKQQFDTMSSMIAVQVARVLGGKAPIAQQLYAPASLLTRATLTGHS
jgi:ribose transport system substrate-binding protein